MVSPYSSTGADPKRKILSADRILSHMSLFVTQSMATRNVALSEETLSVDRVFIFTVRARLRMPTCVHLGYAIVGAADVE